MKVWWRICGRYHFRKAARLRRAAQAEQCFHIAQRHVKGAINAARLSEKFFDRIKGQ